MLGISQTELANRVGIAQGTLSKIEQGLKEVTEEFVDRLSQALNCHRSFFSLPERLYGGPVSASPMYRKKSSIGIKTIDKLIAELNVRIAHIRKLLQFVDFQPELPFPHFDPEEYERGAITVAQYLRRTWYVPTGPIRNLVELLERAGCIIIDCDMDDSGLSGVSYNIHGLPPLIFINKNQPLDRYRFTLAHELGHLIMHQCPNPKMEEEANAFAAEFLMPEKDISIYLSNITIESSAALKPFWRTSMASLIYRARSLGKISESQYIYIWRLMSAKGYKIDEPVKLQRLGEEPSILKELFEKMRVDFDYTSYEVEISFGLYSLELDHLYQKTQPHRLRAV